MKSLFYLSLAFFLSTSAWSRENAEHFPVDMDGYEYRNWFAKHPEFFPERTDELQKILIWGARNLEWIDAVNAPRARDSRLELSTPETVKVYPVESPKENNREIVEKKYQDVLDKIPASIQDVLVGNGDLPTTIPVPDEDFLFWARQVDAVYQSTSRWLLQEPSLSIYAARSTDDIRGYYFLRKIDRLEEKLRAWDERSPDEKEQWKQWFISVCHNSDGSKESCRKKWDENLTRDGNPVAFYQSFWQASRKLFDAFFLIQSPRDDAEFHKPNDFILPFVRPTEDRIQNWLRDNIEDGWRYDAFQLRLRFEDQARNRTRVVFEAGATPHVNGLGGNTITMDANRNIDEYLTRWTIRHEFGHVLGFPDCYVEFYDTDRGVMINYQIDVTNIMCSRRGKLQYQHVEEMRRAYPDAPRDL